MTNVNIQDYPKVTYPKRNKYIDHIVDFCYRQKLKIRFGRIEKINNLAPGILDGVNEFYEKTGSTKADYIQRLTEIISILEQHKPTNIAEMGSGRSSLVFAAWAKKQGIVYKAFEQLDYWLQLTNSIVSRVTEKTHVIKQETVEIPNFGGRYKNDIDPNCDFIYVDGPTILVKNNQTTHTKKSCYTDAADFLRQGGKPKVIMVEGRTDSIDLIMAEAARLNLNFEFKPSYHWAIQRRQYRQSIALRHHGIITFKW